ncbi:MAG: LAGLIDADG family homing endonuclease [Nitrososphaeria archaeon]
MEVSSDSRLKEIFSSFVRAWVDESNQPKYRVQLSSIVQKNANSLVVDYSDLTRWNSSLAAESTKDPMKYLDLFSKSALEFLREEDPEYAKKVEKYFVVRLRNLPERHPLRKLDVGLLSNLVAVTGIVVRVSEVKPYLIEAAWICPNNHLNMMPQRERILRKPAKCVECGAVDGFKLDELKCTYINYQVLRIQELPEELPPGQLPRQLDIRLYGDVVDVARPGDRVVVTGILKAEEEYSVRGSRLRTFNALLEGNHVEVLGKAPEDIVVEKTDELKFKELAKRPDWIKMLVSSFSPSIYGHELLKEAILLLIVGAPQITLPDGTALRGDINILLIGDPGCLVFDERVVLGDGAIVKIGRIGKTHLQQLSVHVLTGEQEAEKATATTYHIYRDQPIMEVVTESGKSIKGTYNHPLLTQRWNGKRMVREWKRLDEIAVGDRVMVVARIPCTIKEYLPTGFRPLEGRRRGPKFKGRLPKLLTPELASLLGYLLGSGWICRDGYRFGFVVAEPQKDILRQLNFMVENLFGIRAHVFASKKHERNVAVYYSHYYSVNANHNLTFLRERRVPELILSSGNKVVASFLKWLYEADGTVSVGGSFGKAIVLKAKNIELLRDVQILLLRFGIHSKIIGCALLICRGEDVTGFACHVGFASRKKKGALDRLLSNLPKPKRVHRNRVERVVKVVKAGERADVYDIEVPGKHMFIANGIISHNTAKSELLKYSAKLAPRGLYTSGKGTTAAGLTAAVVREKSGMLMLEAGAVVLADQGICAIDEFDKMSSIDRQALHEAMEQQSYHPGTEVMFSNGEKVRIGEFVDKLIDLNRQRVIRGKDCEILSLSGLKEFRILTTDFREVYRTTIHRVSRHKASNHFVKITYANGRSITVTPEHPIYVLKDGEIVEVRADRLKKCMFAPVPAVYPIEDNEVLLGEASGYSFKESLVTPRRLDENFSRLLGYIVSKGRICSSGGDSEGEVTVSDVDGETIDDIFEIVKAAFKVEPRLQCGEIQERGGTLKSLLTDRRVLLPSYGFFEANFPELMGEFHERRIPRCIFRTSKVNRVQFLLAAFKGSGFIDSDKLGYVTGSMGLAEDYSDLLLSLGVYSYITEFVDCHSKDKRFSKTAYKVVVSGRESIAKFYELIGKHDKRKDKVGYLVRRSKTMLDDRDKIPAEVAAKIRKLLKEFRQDGHLPSHVGLRWMMDRNFALACLERLEKHIPAFDELSRMEDVREIREKFRISVAEVASKMRKSTDVIERIERNRVAEDYGLLLASVKQLAMVRVEGVKSSISKLKALIDSRIHFVKIKDVKLLDNEGVEWVYDVTVEPSHTFISEGLVLHNTVSVAKGGIVVTLNARTSILSAANPLLGKYDPYKNLAENINLPSPLLTRFDLIFVIRDVPERVVDEQIASHIMAIRRSRSFAQKPPLDINFLRKYLLYCKNINPTITAEAEKMIIDFYLEMRSQTESQAIPVTPRQLESLIRLAMARARLLLRNEVTREDVAEAITLTKNMLYTVAVDRKTGKIDMGTITGVPASERSKLEVVFQKYKELAGPTNEPVELNALIKAIVETGKFNEVEAKILFSQLEQKGVFYMVKPGYYRRA